MSLGKVYVTRRIREAGLNLLTDAGAEVRVWPGEENQGPTPEEVIEGAQWADVLLSLLTEPIGREVMEANPSLRGVAQFAVGYDNIDVAVATELGVPVKLVGLGEGINDLVEFDEVEFVDALFE